MVTPVQVAIAALVGVQAAGCGYLLALTLASPFFRRKAPTRDGAPKTRFAVIVPAHNEEEMLPATLASLDAQAYPRDLFGVNVIADNCTDATAAIAHAAGATVHERNDPSNPGKGQAISWLLPRLLANDSPPDAFVFVDADSGLSPDFLDVMDRYLANGERALQASYRVADPEGGPLVALRAIAFALMHDLRGRGKARLGISCGFWGNGMAIERALLTDLGWQAHTAVEDAEQHLKLLIAGGHVAYVPDATVAGHMPATFGGAAGQQVRWEGGRLALARRYWRPLLAATLHQRRLSPLAALADLALPPLSVLGAGSAAVTAAALVVGPPATAGVAVASTAALGAYVVIGCATSGLPLRTYAALLHTPRFVAWKLMLYGRELLKRRDPDWHRTQRDQL
jgi:hypothetical protein